MNIMFEELTGRMALRGLASLAAIDVMTAVYGARDVMQGRTLSTKTARSSLHAKEHGFTMEDSNLRLVSSQEATRLVTGS
jgi:hypothetical protein